MAVKLKVEGIFWIVSVFVRFLWAFYPQTGYIHPDEFFQSPEIVAGDVFGFKILKTWEFNETFPIRSILLPYLCTGLPFAFLQRLHTLATLPWSLNSWELVVAPRVAFCCLSMLIDLSAFKISRILEVDPSPALSVIGTSYVMLVFHTRPFSNSLESVIFALFLWILANHLSSVKSTCTLFQTRLRNLGIGIIVVAGVWNRPTFLAYALVPSLSWCYKLFKDSDMSWMSTLIFVKQTCCVGAGVIVTAVVFIATDSAYFGCLTVTPFNFIKYNLDTSHLKEHGLHPRFTHFLVNMPLMFGCLAVIYYGRIIAIVYTWKFMVSQHLKSNDTHELSNAKDKGKNEPLNSKLLHKVLTLSIVVPVGLLSLIPHQEPRFLAPVLTPLAILFGHIIIGPKQSSLATASWFFWNVIGCLLFGVLHQGGMYPCLQYLQGHLSTISASSRVTTYHVVFSNTYMPPRHLLAWPVCAVGSDCPVTTNSLIVHDLGGQTTDELTYWLQHLIKSEKENGVSHQVFMVCPSTLYFHHPQFHKVKEFFPHLTMEDPPNLGSFLDFRNQCKHEMNSSKICLLDDAWSNNYWEFLSSWFKSNLSLNLYEYKEQNDKIQ